MRAGIRFVDFQTSARSARDLLVAVVAVAGAFILPSPVWAQSDAAVLGSAAETVSLPDVTVTARKREESLQETPISVTVFSRETLEEANMRDLRDIGKYTPGMTFTSYGMGSAENGSIFLRGIGQADHMVTTDPGVGLYVDGVYIGRHMGAALDLLEIERVEVLRGPQGTLFGKNTIGGAINVVTAKPTGEIRGHVGVTVGDRYRINVEGSGEVALGDRLAVKASVLSLMRDGVSRQVFTDDDLGDENSFSGRGQLSWMGDASSLYVVVDGQRARQHSAPHSFYAHGGPLADLAPCYRRGGPQDVEPFVPCPAGTDVDPFTNYSLDDHDSTLDVYGVSGTWTWEFGERARLKTISAYRDMEYLGNLDFDGAPQVLLHYRETGASDQFSQEVQLSGDTAAGTLNWIAGFYYFTEDGYNLQDDDPFIDNAFGGLDQRKSEVETHSYAGFGQATFDVTRRLSLTGGVRYTREEKDYDVVYRELDNHGRQATDVQGQPVYKIPPTALDDSWGKVSGTASARYRLGDDLMVYATYARGFRSGGFAARPTSTFSVGSYDPEFVDMYEVGLKAQAADDRLRVNLAFYFNDYQDYQASVNELNTATNSFDSRTLNAAAAEILGVELEGAALLPPYFRLDGTFAYTDAEITEVDLAPSLRANFRKGSRLPFVSKYTFSLSPRVSIPLPWWDTSVMLRADYAYRSASYGQISNESLEREGGYGVLNARLEWWGAAEQWKVALYGINLADEEYTRVRNYFPGFLGFALWNTDRREVGVKVRCHF